MKRDLMRNQEAMLEKTRSPHQDWPTGFIVFRGLCLADTFWGCRVTQTRPACPRCAALSTPAEAVASAFDAKSRSITGSALRTSGPLDADTVAAGCRCSLMLRPKNLLKTARYRVFENTCTLDYINFVNGAAGHLSHYYSTGTKLMY